MYFMTVASIMQILQIVALKNQKALRCRALVDLAAVITE
jgi:hypothetical protein